MNIFLSFIPSLSLSLLLSPSPLSLSLSIYLFFILFSPLLSLSVYLFLSLFSLFSNFLPPYPSFLCYYFFIPFFYPCSLPLNEPIFCLSVSLSLSPYIYIYIYIFRIFFCHHFLIPLFYLSKWISFCSSSVYIFLSLPLSRLLKRPVLASLLSSNTHSCLHS